MQIFEEHMTDTKQLISQMKCLFMVEKAGKQTVSMEIIGENYHTALVQRGPVYYYRYRVCMHVSNRYVLLVI